MSNQPARPFGDPGQLLNSFVASAGKVGELKNQRMGMNLAHRRGMADQDLSRQQQQFQQEMVIAEFNQRYGGNVPTNMRQAESASQAAEQNYTNYNRQLGVNEVTSFPGEARSAQVEGHLAAVENDILNRSVLQSYKKPLGEMEGQALSQIASINDYLAPDQLQQETNRAMLLSRALGMYDQGNIDKTRRTFISDAIVQNSFRRSIADMKVDRGDVSEAMSTGGGDFATDYMRYGYGWVPGISSIYADPVAGNEADQVDSMQEMINAVNKTEKGFFERSGKNLKYAAQTVAFGALGDRNALVETELDAFGDDGYLNSETLGKMQYFKNMSTATSNIGDVAYETAKSMGIKDVTRLDNIRSKSNKIMNIVVKGYIQNSSEIQDIQFQINRAAEKGNEAAVSVMTNYLRNSLGVDLESNQEYSGAGGGLEAIRNQIDGLLNVPSVEGDAGLEQMKQDNALIGQIVGDVAQVVGTDWADNLDRQRAISITDLGKTAEGSERIAAASESLDMSQEDLTTVFKSKKKLAAAEAKTARKWMSGFEEIMGERHSSRIELLGASSAITEMLAPWREASVGFKQDPYQMTEAISDSIERQRRMDIESLNALGQFSGPAKGNVETYDYFNPTRDELLKFRDEAITRQQERFDNVKAGKEVSAPKRHPNPAFDAIEIAAYNAAKADLLQEGSDSRALDEIDAMRRTDKASQFMREQENLENR